MGEKRRIAYTDPLNTKKPWVEEWDGRYWLWNPPQGGTFKLIPDSVTGGMKAEKVSDDPGKNTLDVPVELFTHSLRGGAVAKKYGNWAKKSPVCPFQVIEVVLENLDRQADVLRQDRDKALKDALAFKEANERTMKSNAELEKTVQNLTQKLQELETMKERRPSS